MSRKSQRAPGRKSQCTDFKALLPKVDQVRYAALGFDEVTGDT